MGAMGKSAQFLLHTWLPDAMEGPTPVSALIHAATMVTAGVFMVARLSPLFEQAPFAQTAVLVIGAITAFFAATVGLVQNDIKRVIAYSTCSQLGYMFVALGAGAYSIGIFHLFTHAFFKALLFLGAGSVIIAMHHEQDMRKMGGLWKSIPFTGAMMVIGTLSLTGFPFTAGFYSKDAIIQAAYASDRRGPCLRLSVHGDRRADDGLLLLAPRLHDLLRHAALGRGRGRMRPMPHAHGRPDADSAHCGNGGRRTPPRLRTTSTAITGRSNPMRARSSCSCRSRCLRSARSRRLRLRGRLLRRRGGEFLERRARLSTRAS